MRQSRFPFPGNSRTIKATFIDLDHFENRQQEYPNPAVLNLSPRCGPQHIDTGHSLGGLFLPAKSPITLFDQKTFMLVLNKKTAQKPAFPT